MNGPGTDRLFDLLPAVYRERDAEEGYPLRALLRIINAQAALIDGDIQGLYENLFIETCRPWVIPYIGDLVDNNLLYDVSRIAGPDTAAELFTDLIGTNLRPPIAARIRADVAKTIYYRRRKGTPAMLEELARDVTGWPAHVVEFFERLGWIQNLEHLRFRSAWADVRSVDRMDRVNGPFDETSHTVDVRRIRQSEGWYNIPNIGFFLWRLRSYPLQRVPARQGSLNWRFHFSPLGHKAPLFSRWRQRGTDSGLSTEIDIAGPIRRAFFYEDLQAYRNLPPPRPDFTDLYGLFDPIPGNPLEANPDASFVIFRNGDPVAPSQDPTAPLATYQPQIICSRLDPWPATRPAGRVIAVDVESGRLAIGNGWGSATRSMDVFYHYGFSADMGGGPYDRRRWLIRPDLATTHFRVKEDGIVPPGAPPVTHTDMLSALNDWQAANQQNTIITILDSRTYALPATVRLDNERFMAIEAANGERPLLQTDPAGLEVQVDPPAAGDLERRAELTLNGVAVEGWVHVTGDLGRFRLLHSTLIPGRSLTEDGEPVSADASLRVEPGPANAPINEKLRVEIAFSILGPALVPEFAAGIWLLDSIVDGLGPEADRFGATAVGAPAGPGPRLAVERSTILGTTLAKELHASESIFAGRVDIVRTQEGCVRFCYVTPDSHTPRRFRCQPDLEVETELAEALEQNPGLSLADQAKLRAFVQGWLVPGFTALRYGQPAYCQLAFRCPEQIRAGAEDGAEMGVFSHLKQPQRESNLRIRLDEYLPFGLEAGIIYVT